MYLKKPCPFEWIACLAFISLSSVPLNAHATCVGLGCNCTVKATSFNFGNYSPLSGLPTNSTGVVTVTCSALVLNALVNYTIDLSQGGSGSYTTRQLSNTVTPVNKLNYNLYTTAAGTSIWGNGSGGTANVSDGYLISILAPIERNYTVYGTIPGSQQVKPGTYTDNITATITF